MSAYEVLCNALKAQEVKQCYGIIGIPVIELAMYLHTSEILFYAFRNEQGASYAAGIEGYLTSRPGICITVSGPGFTNALSGLANAKENSWPMILISGSSEISQIGMDAFQEFPQHESAKEFCKWSVRVSSIQMIPRVIERAFRVSMSGRPGPVYIDLPSDILREGLNTEVKIEKFYSVSLPAAPQEDVEKVCRVLKTAKKPLVIIGKGAAYSRAEREVIEFINKTGIPFLPTPMGKGVVPDDHPLCVSAARSTALGQADVILLLGARLNWILHFGQPPRYSASVKFLSINIDAQELSNNCRSEVDVCSDIRNFMLQLNTCCQSWKWYNPEWISQLKAGIQKNEKLTIDQLSSPSFNYYKALTKIHEVIPKDAILVTEGSNTMDIARTVINSYLPRSRLDAGSFGTMGVAIPACIAAKVLNPNRTVVAVVGDSSFGFSAMELETMTRYGLDVVVFIVNNNGIMAGVSKLGKGVKEIMPNALNPASKYELLAQAFGGKGFEANSPEELEAVAKVAMREKGVRIVNVRISPDTGKKPQQHFWLTPKI